MKILRSALKHGCTTADILHAVAGAWQRIQVGEDPDRWLYVGVDGSAGASRAVRWAASMAQPGSTGIVAVHALYRAFFAPGRR